MLKLEDGECAENLQSNLITKNQPPLGNLGSRKILCIYCTKDKLNLLFSIIGVTALFSLIVCAIWKDSLNKEQKIILQVIIGSFGICALVGLIANNIFSNRRKI